MNLNTCSAETSADSTCTNSQDYPLTPNLFSEPRAPVLISSRRFCPMAAETKKRRKSERLNQKPGIRGTLDDGGYFTIFTDDAIDKYTVEPIHLMMEFHELFSSFTPIVSKKRNDEGDHIRLDEHEGIYDLLASTRYRYAYNISDIAAEGLLHDEETVREVKSIPEMNLIEYCSQYPKFTPPVLIYQILTLAKCLYKADREQAGMQTVYDTAGNPCKHTVQVLDIAEGLINSASDIDWINLMFCSTPALHHVIAEVLNAAGYVNYSTIDATCYSGVYTGKVNADTVTTLEDELADTVRRIDRDVWRNITVTRDFKRYAEILDTLKNREHEPTL